MVGGDCWAAVDEATNAKTSMAFVLIAVLLRAGWSLTCPGRAAASPVPGLSEYDLSRSSTHILTPRGELRHAGAMVGRSRRSRHRRRAAVIESRVARLTVDRVGIPRVTFPEPVSLWIRDHETSHA